MAARGLAPARRVGLILVMEFQRMGLESINLVTLLPEYVLGRVVAVYGSLISAIPSLYVVL